MAGGLRIKRVYDRAERGDGRRVLIDRVWPRGVSKGEAGVDDWARDLAPSAELRRWFGHEPSRFPEFRKRYRRELAAQVERVEDLRARSRRETVTLLFGARDREHNNAVVLAELVRGADPGGGRDRRR